MKVRPLFVLGAVGLGATVLLLRRNECEVSMHPDDWRVPEGGNAHRKYRSPGHAFHHLKEAAGLTVPTAEVYLRQAIPPVFREQIMIITAACNNCPV